MMKQHLFLKGEDAILPLGNQGFKSGCGRCGGRGIIPVPEDAFLFSVLLLKEQ
jgi:hypothetical protein